jgi:PAS domain S-box-containing protein
MSDATRFEDFARISADWFWETDIEDRFSYFSVPITRTGIVLDGRLGSRRRDGAAPEPDNLERLAALEAAIERREPFRDFVFRVGNQAGQMRWCSISGEPRHDRTGAFLGYRGAGRDLTEQLEAQREVELQGLALQAILQAMPDGVQLVDKSDGLLAVNDQIYEILDIPNRAAQRDAGSTFLSTLDLARRGEYGPGDPETMARRRSAELREMIASQRALTYERQLMTGRWVECRHRALDDGARLSLYRDITDAKAREAELERQSAVLSTITANMDGGIVVFDRDNRLVAWNSGFTDLIGIDPALARHGTTLREILVAQAKSGEFGPCDPEAEADRRIANYHGDRALVSERTRPNGRIIELRRNPIPGGGSVTIYIDVTKRRQAEQALEELNATLERRIAERTEALAESERFQSTLLANVPGIVYRCRNDRDWTMEFVSEGCRVLLGLAPQDLVGGSTTYNELIHPDDREMVWQAVQRDFAADRPFELEYRVRHADGSYRWVWDRAHAIRVDAGKVEAMEGFVLDITQRKVAERELARVRDNLSDAVESMTHGIMLFDRDRRLVLFNRQVLGHYVGPSDMLTIGNKFEENIAAAIEHGKIPLAPGQTAAAFIAERLAKFERATGEVTERHMPDGRILHISDHRTLSGGTVSMGVDVTERVRIEQRLREVQRMESIGQLTGGLAHDFNNYLAVVIGNLDLLADCRYDDPEAPKLIEGALAGAQRGAELTRSLLAFSRRQPLNPRSLDVGQRVNDVARLLKRAIGEKITLDVKVAPGLWPVEIDAAQLDSAIVNLANNARDAMPEGGTLTLAVRNAEAGAAEQPAGDHVLIEMIDTGRGMDEATQARAFEPFFSTKGPGHGTGLGLSMVHGFVHQSGGTIRLQSAKGKGTTVQLFLPRATRPVARPAPAGAALPRGTESVLVVEDNADVRAMVVTQLKSLGYRVVEADSGDAALAVLEERSGGFDLLISDMVMPGEIDGLALAKMARQRWPKLAILLTTGFSDVIVDEAGDGKAVDFGVLRKPYRKAEIARAMRAALTIGGA